MEQIYIFLIYCNIEYTVIFLKIYLIHFLFPSFKKNFIKFSFFHMLQYGITINFFSFRKTINVFIY